jgi:hypothetical protein
VLTFSHPNPFPPPFHPHLHTNGPATHAVVLIFNALLAHKRVMFLGHGLPANQVARMVLAACAMASGCGQVLRGITETAFPYANLASLDILEEFSGFVAGVTNPRFEELPMTWDVLCNVETGKVTVSKELKSGSIGAMKQSSGSSLGSVVKVEEDTQAGTPQAKMNSATKADCVDNQFMDDVGGIGLACLTDRYSRQLEATMARRILVFGSRTTWRVSSDLRHIRSIRTPDQRGSAIPVYRTEKDRWVVGQSSQMMRQDRGRCGRADIVSMPGGRRRVTRCSQRYALSRGFR